MNQLLVGDCLDVLRTLPDCSVDSVVTDPPAGIAFMGKTWDGNRGGRDQWVAWLAKRLAECLRVLKPGGHAVVWALPRTSGWTHRALEDAGFEVRDCLTHLFGSGFPKSLDVGKAIDRAEWDGWDGWGTALKPAAEFWYLARKPLAGTVAANVVEWGTGAINVDACRVAGVPHPGGCHAVSIYGTNGNYEPGPNVPGNPAGRWPANVALTHHPDCDGGCADDCPVAELDRQSGVLHSGGDLAPYTRQAGDRVLGHALDKSGAPKNYTRPGDSGGASRFFPTFRYQAKPSTREKNGGLDDRNHHPTVKPVELMRWLTRLITPPGGVALDPFAGSGTTLVAAALEGFDTIGIEREAEYLPIIEGRVRWAESQCEQAQLPLACD